MKKPISPVVAFWLPLHLVAQVQSREHWRAIHARATRHKVTAWAIGMAELRRAGAPRAPYRVKIVRIGPRRMDDDNVVGSAKAVRDGIAQLLGVDDGDRKAIRFTYGQRIGNYGVNVTIKGAP